PLWTSLCLARVGPRRSFVQISQDGELGGGRSRGGIQLRRDLQRPACGGHNLLHSDAGMQAGERELLGFGIWSKNAQVGDHVGGPFPRQTEFLPAIASLEITSRR